MQREHQPRFIKVTRGNEHTAVTAGAGMKRKQLERVKLICLRVAWCHQDCFTCCIVLFRRQNNHILIEEERFKKIDVKGNNKRDLSSGDGLNNSTI